MASRRRSRSSNERELRLWRVGRALVLTFVAAILVAGGVFYALVVLLDFKEIDTSAKLDAKTLFDLVKLSFGVVAGTGALVALVVAYRRQRVDEVGAHREATRLHTERFSQAVDKLGSESPAVRLGGVHALAGLADDAPDESLRQTCIDVLCAYLRLPFTPDPGDLPDPLPDGNSLSEERRDTHQAKKDRYRALREVRHTILRLTGDHYRIPKGTQRSWQGCNLDLTGVAIDGDMDFRGAVFSESTMDFRGAVFSSGTVDFRSSVFSGGTVHFRGAVFSSGTVDFRSSVFSGGTVDFSRSVFSSDTVFSSGTVAFSGATFSGGAVTFRDSVFSGDTVTFRDSVFSSGTVDFRGSEFTSGTVTFQRAKFSGGNVLFSRSEFSGGNVDFRRSEFTNGNVAFQRAEFSGGNVDFRRSEFSGGFSVDFRGAELTGSTMDFRDVTGSVPNGLLPAAGNPVLAGVILPSAWLPPAP
ncbi:pentapeptide repeat-containing protein [Streptomyces sp. NPDC048462]|uniref:pentapeptide repeat-containing protein n=1 Tax=Streptomyces sp. NPDC048462 TaxID=3365555 RepID=UPI003715019F